MEVDPLFEPLESKIIVEINVLDHGSKFFDRLQAWRPAKGEASNTKIIEMAFDEKVPFEDLGAILEGIC